MNDNSVILDHRVDPIASKPAPTKSVITCSMTVQLFPGARFRA